MDLTEFKELRDDESKIKIAIAIIENTANSFAQSLVLQWKRGVTFSTKQRLHLFLLAEQQITSIARGYSGIDHDDSTYSNNTNKFVADQRQKKAFPQKNIKLRFKRKYRIQDIIPLLEAYGVVAEKSINEDGAIGWMIGGNWYRTLREFVVWICDEDPTHPLAGGVSGDRVG